MNTRSFIGVKRDPVVFAISVSLMLMAVVVLVVWHGYFPAPVQIVAGLKQMHYNTALCFLALGAAGIGLSSGRWLVMMGGGGAAAWMGGAVTPGIGDRRLLGHQHAVPSPVGDAG